MGETPETGCYGYIVCYQWLSLRNA